MKLREFFLKNPETAIAFSGGVDSAYLLYAAMRWGKRVKAYYVKSQFQPEFELQDALELAKDLGVDMEVIRVDVLADPVIASNPIDRCYYCKKMIFNEIKKAATADGFSLLKACVMNCAVTNAGKHRHSRISENSTKEPGITIMIWSIKTSASTGATLSTRQKRIPAYRLTVWKKCRLPLKRLRKKPFKGKRQSKQKKPARKISRTGCTSRAAS